MLTETEAKVKDVLQDLDKEFGDEDDERRRRGARRGMSGDRIADADRLAADVFGKSYREFLELKPDALPVEPSRAPGRGASGGSPSSGIGAWRRSPTT